MIRRILLKFAAATAFTLSSFMSVAYADSQNISFDQSWEEQGFLRLFSNDYGLCGRQLDVVSDGTVTVLWRPVDPGRGGSEQANWDWSVAEGVRPTDLAQRGGDDRNLALYFVFVGPQTSKSLNRNSARKILSSPATKMLVYVWGGDHPKGALLSSPYSAGLKTKVLQTAQIGSFAEVVNLDRDLLSRSAMVPKYWWVWL